MGTVLRTLRPDRGVRDLPLVEREPRMPAGFVAGGTAIGIKESRRPDLALIAADRPVAVAATFTRNLFAAAPGRVPPVMPTRPTSAPTLLRCSRPRNATCWRCRRG